MEHAQCLVVFQLPNTHDMNAATGGVESKTPGQHQCSKRGAYTMSCCDLVITYPQHK